MTGRRSSRRWFGGVLAALVVASAVLHVVGIERNLPDARDVDEDVLVRPAIRIVSSGSLNPGWFGYPGSTVIYPLAALLHVQQAAFHGGRWLAPNPAVRHAFFGGDFARYVRTGRLLSVAYGVATVALVAVAGVLAFEPRTALVAAALVAFTPLAIEYAQPLRSDSAAAFWGLAFSTAVLQVLRRPDALRWHVLAGAMLGLAVASRYMMAACGAVLLAAQEHLWRHGEQSRSRALSLLAGWLAVPAAFFLATPYFVLAARSAFEGLAAAAANQQAHLGIEPLGFAGNLLYYLGDALPGALGWPAYAFALGAVAVAAWRRRTIPLLLALHVAAFLVGISLLGIHWQRWVVPALPVVALLAAHGAVGATDAVVERLAGGRRRAALALLAVTLALVTPQGREAARRSLLFAKPSTEIAALDWVLANVPPGSRIAHEWYSAPLVTAKRARPKRYQLLSPTTLSRHPLRYYRANGYEYLLTSSHMYGRYQRHPGRHAREIAFYRRLREVAQPVHEVRPSETQRGPVVTVYRLPLRGARVAGRRAATPGGPRPQEAPGNGARPPREAP